MRRPVVTRRETHAPASGRRLLNTLTVALIVAGGCGGTDNPASKPELHLLSILRGSLHRDVSSGCVWVGKDGEKGAEVRWPPGYRLQSEPLRLLRNGRPIASPGESVQLGVGVDSRFPAQPRCREFVLGYKFSAHAVKVISQD